MIEPRPGVRLIEARNRVILAALAVLSGEASTHIATPWAGSLAAECAYEELSAAGRELGDAQTAWDEYCADANANRAAPAEGTET